MPRIDLEVDFSEKDLVKALGARWDKSVKKWYVPDGVDAAVFAQWLPEVDDDVDEAEPATPLPADAKNILRFWRDIEIFNIPKAPKTESSDKLRVATFKPGEALPWQPDCKYSYSCHENEAWTHAVYIGVAKCSDWGRIILSAVNPDQLLSENDLQQLGGRGWLAAFTVTHDGWMVADSYLPASFALGVRRLQKEQSFDGLHDDIQTEINFFKERSQSGCPTKTVAQMALSEATGNCGDGLSQPAPALPVGWSELDRELDHALAAFDSRDKAQSYTVVIKSICRKRDAEGGGGDNSPEFLNSFYLNDLDRLIAEADSRHSLGATLSQYLGPASSLAERQDVLQQPPIMARCVAPERLTLGRWPAPSQHPLMLAQQAAVGEIMTQLGDSGGLVAVNGPPGTGKTTLLRDVVADIVVQRAQALATLDKPAQAFGRKLDAGGQSIYPIKASIVAGTGIVVASNNNAAVENITRELPALSAINSDEHAGASYFQEVAAQLFKDAKIKIPAWGLTAAALGNSSNRRTFCNAFFREGAQPFTAGQPCDIKTLLEAAPDDAEQQWADAKQHFLQLLGRIDAARQQFISVAKALPALAAVRQSLCDNRRQYEHQQTALKECEQHWAELLRVASLTRNQSQERCQAAADTEQQCQLALQAAEDRWLAAQAEFAPSLLDRILGKLGFSTHRLRQWQKMARELRLQRASASDAMRQALQAHQQCKHAVADNEHQWQSLIHKRQQQQAQIEHALATLDQQHSDYLERSQALGTLIETFRTTLAQTSPNSAIPDEDFFARNSRERHLASAWVNQQFDLLRAQLFLAALRLHEVTLLCCKSKAIPNLRAVKAMLARDTKEPLADADCVKLWNILFFTIPVISTSLASFDRLFTGMGRGSLGWLLIDEAGQATPQSVAGALWRSRRAVIIGDPRQIEPVMSVPGTIVNKLRLHHGIDAHWSPASESAQTLADRTMRLGAWIGNPAEPDNAVWTGMPLRTHRRCTDPMFSISNTIAYAGQMVQGNLKPPVVQCLLGDSAWIDVHGHSNDGQIVHAETTCLRTILEQLKNDWPTIGDNEKQKPVSIFIITPFRKIKEACSRALKQAGLDRKHAPIDFGTVHTFQGKEADIVLLILGSAPGAAGNGSRQWASAKPNLLNVALTRAKQRVYIIGSINDWQAHPHFDRLAAEMRERQCILSVSALETRMAIDRTHASAKLGDALIPASPAPDSGPPFHPPSAG